MKEIDKIAERFKRGDKSAFEEIYEQFAKKVYNLALRYCRDAQAAEDIAQESFIRVYRHIDSYNEDYSFSAWMMKIVVNLCISHRKSQSKDMQKVINYQEVKRNVSNDPAARIEINDIIQHYLEQLDDISKMMTTLYYIQDFTYEEISEIMECPIGTVKSRLSRAKEKFHEMVSKKKEGNVQ